ncbi:MAG: hypothetical protein ISR51_05615 [Rhodospirillales bacterium]|nr:hypothetical protein [Alphaproteobacteria bacterium]MBL6948136.1 hypothetical protein [Rhodospirillales bacterium]
MPSNSPDVSSDDTPSIQIANQIINVANTRLQDGMPIDVIAQGLRHAAANFSAFAEQHQGSDDPTAVVEEFVRLLEYYLSRHDGPAEPTSQGSLDELIKQAKEEL